ARASQTGGFNPSHHTAYFIACAYAQMGRAEEAVQFLKLASETGFPCYPLLISDSNLDPVRQDLRFKSYLEDKKIQFDSLNSILFPGGNP
ncbi:MAG: TPR end-of-group domain-containing protein, partial [Pirellulaceae bacterium]